ncbi:MAG: DUF2171 domain-containing protein [Anaerolineaceae bacterium]|nr:DUF2171 domain-containing protein [Anaerolineaceae bacterium]
MEFKQGTKVTSYDGKDVGSVDRVVLNPNTKEVTHIVVRKGFLFTEDKIVPINVIATANDQTVTLRQDAGKLDDLPPFEETHYIGLGEEEAESAAYPAGLAEPYYWYAPTAGWMGYPDYGDRYAYPPPYPTETVQNIPANTIALREGAAVVSADGKHVGSVKRIFINSANDHATHFLLSEGLFFKEQKLIPFGWIHDIQEDEVQLNVGSSVLKEVPEFHETPA